MLPKGWANVTLEEITPPGAPIIYGILQPGPSLPDGVPYVRPTEILADEIDLAAIRRTSQRIAEQYRRSTLQTGDVILSIVGTIGKVAEVPSELDGANITQSSCRIRPDTGLVDKRFLRSFLRSPSAKVQYDERRLGTAVPRLNIADIRRFVMSLPPLAEQRRIVAKLDTLTARIARARAEFECVAALGGSNKDIKLLDRLEAAILAKAFRGELVPQDPADEPASVLLDRIRAERAAAPSAKRGWRKTATA